jgi:hypothetical protein
LGRHAMSGGNHKMLCTAGYGGLVLTRRKTGANSPVGRFGAASGRRRGFAIVVLTAGLACFYGGFTAGFEQQDMAERRE